MELLVVVGAGLAIGLSMGTVGGGGAILAVPVLVYGLGQTPVQATTGSLIVVGVTGVLGAWLAWRQQRLDLRQGLVFGAAAVVGSAVGALVAPWVAPSVLMACFATLMLVTAFTMVRRIVRPVSRGTDGARPVWTDGRFDARQVAKVAAVATVVGFLTGFLGVGGGFMIVPALTLVLGVPMKKASGTSLMVIAISCATALVTRLVSAPAEVQPHWASIAVLTGLAVVGLGVGSAVAARANNRQLSIGFAALVCAVAVYTTVRTLLPLV